MSTIGLLNIMLGLSSAAFSRDIARAGTAVTGFSQMVRQADGTMARQSVTFAKMAGGVNHVGMAFQNVAGKIGGFASQIAGMAGYRGRTLDRRRNRNRRETRQRL